MTSKQFSFFRKRLQEMAESFFLHDVIDSRRCAALQSFPGTRRGKSSAAELFSHGEVTLSDYSLRLHLKHLREMNGRRFQHIQIMFLPKTSRPRRVCFVGHRLLPEVTRTLRWNLRQVLEPYNVQLDWSGRDIRSVQIFDDIVSQIKKADFCVFDNRATGSRPNVYIEAGVAYAVETPFVLFDYARQRAESIPSDLSHSFAIKYYSYNKLFREFYSRLPVFFERNFGSGR